MSPHELEAKLWLEDNGVPVTAALVENLGLRLRAVEMRGEGKADAKNRGRSQSVGVHTLGAVARWLNEEYRRVSMADACGGRRLSERTAEARVIQGMQGALADAEAAVKQWARTGREPPHRRVHLELQLRFEREAREDEELIPWPGSEEKPWASTR